jgi:hypothetical protein
MKKVQIVFRVAKFSEDMLSTEILRMSPPDYLVLVKMECFVGRPWDHEFRRVFPDRIVAQ